ADVPTVEIERAQELAAMNERDAQPAPDRIGRRAALPQGIVVAVRDEHRLAGYPQGLDGGALQYALVLVRRLDAQHRTDRARFLQRAIRLDDQQRAVIAGDQAQHLVQHHVDHLVDRKSTRLNSSHVKISYAV